ncbi:MAG: ADP-ribosylglycohydrolase family protein [Clostridia bacterium]|nr:ADP-ribosylglycohydrolase family protein [Clostridia bacterium]
MNLNWETYIEKMRGCWLGKNIGGTLGAPFECKQGVVDLEYYTHDLSKGVLPNDDLDLQLVWLIAVEEYGKKVDAEVLGNYWVSHISPDWSEYGMGKRNLRAGMLPSVSGTYHNTFYESNGAWIRSEIWACLAPGHPEIATKYAYEDAIVDHGGEGVYAEIFCAAMQSAAFTESDMEKIIDIGLSYIPEDCETARAVNFVRQLPETESDWKAARKKLMQAFPSSFGERPLPGEALDPEIPFGEYGHDAPANIGLMLLGHYYGGGDFSRSICITAGCCEDADCTAGTLAALYGIILGASGIDRKWTDPIGDEIKTKSVDVSKMKIPTVGELTARVARAMPAFMGPFLSFDKEGRIHIYVREGSGQMAPLINVGFRRDKTFRDLIYGDRMCIRRESPFFDVRALFDTADIEEGKPLSIDLRIVGKMGWIQRTDWNKIVWHIPEEWEAIGGRESMFTMERAWHEKYYSTGVIPHNLTEGKYEVTLEIRLGTFPSRIYIPFVFMKTLDRK